MQIISSCAILSMLVLNVLCGKNNNWNITITPAKVIAIPGLCAQISCTFTYTEEAKLKEIQWKVYNKDKYILSSWNARENKLEVNETGRIKMLEPDLTKNNCSIIMEDIIGDEKQLEIKMVDQQQETHSSSVNISIRDRPKLVIPILREGVEVNLSCSAYFPCPETPPNITWWIRREDIINLDKNSISLNTQKRVFHSNLTLIPTSDLANATVGCDVSYGNKIISDNKTLKFESTPLPIPPKALALDPPQVLSNLRSQILAGETLDLNCTIKSHPPSTDPVRSFNGTTDKLKNQTSAENHTIVNVGKEDAGVYICEMTNMNKTFNMSIRINIIGVTGGDNMDRKDQKMANTSTGIINSLMDLPNILTFATGMACSAFIYSVILCCWASCRRDKKHKVPTANPDAEINLETVQTDIALTGTTEQTPLHEQPEEETPEPKYEAEEDEAVGTEAEDVNYASINYSLLKDRPPDEAEKELVNTDYAEIKKDRRADWNESEDPQDGDDQIKTSDQVQMEEEEELYSQVQ